MEDFDMIQRRREEIRQRILKGFETDIEKAEDNELEKAVYTDNPQNRKLGRVGKEFDRRKSKHSKMNLKPGRTVGYKNDTNEPYEIHSVDKKTGKAHIKGKKSGFSVLNVPEEHLKPTSDEDVYDLLDTESYEAIVDCEDMKWLQSQLKFKPKNKDDRNYQAAIKYRISELQKNK